MPLNFSFVPVTFCFPCRKFPASSAAASLPRQEAGMAFRPCRQQGASDCTGVRKHPGHLPCRLRIRHLLLMECTSSCSCEVEVVFFRLCLWHLYQQMCPAQFLPVLQRDVTSTLNALPAQGCTQFQSDGLPHVYPVCVSHYQNSHYVLKVKTSVQVRP